ncbi:outer dense fiber protein 2-like isoform X2 [Neolamprologus brichardi]|uniref:outer dense fiber protein 2-like isoform X2 n=1 Tax=Neolamprologus brichardi TaxID=32507 RepID=UPI0003EC3352|nr:outer dense fiber protein 2-like isoform X2 [Neolamprologus brichardi]
MDVIEENMSSKEMLEKIAELEYSQSLLRDQNADMRKLLDGADDDMAALGSENKSLRKQVEAMEKVFQDLQQTEAEPCIALADDFEAHRRNEEKIRELEKESTVMKEKYEKLAAELKSLQQEIDQDKLTLSNLKFEIQDLKFQREEDQSKLEHKNEALHRASIDLQLNQLNETVEECFNNIKDLRQTTQELSKQLEDRRDEATFDLMREKKRVPNRPLSFAEEIKLLASTAEMNTGMTDSTNLGNCLQEEAKTEELLKPHLPAVKLQSKRCPGTLEKAIWRVGFFMLCIFILMIIAFVASGCFAGTSDFSSFTTLWTSAHLMLQPYWSVQYGALPPI